MNLKQLLLLHYKCNIKRLMDTTHKFIIAELLHNSMRIRTMTDGGLQMPEHMLAHLIRVLTRFFHSTNSNLFSLTGYTYIYYHCKRWGASFKDNITSCIRNSRYPNSK